MSIEPRTVDNSILWYNGATYMPQSPNLAGASQVRPTRRWGRWIVVGVISLLILGFLSQVGYYMWQFRYGNPGEIAKLQAQFQSGEWSGTKTGDAPPPLSDPKSHIKTTNPTLGPASAKVTIIAFIDFECPFCRQSQPIFDTVLEKYGPAVRVVYKALPLTSIHPNALAAANAAACAQDQGKFWEYYHLLFKREALDDAGLTSAAETLKLDQAKFVACIKSQRHQAEIEADVNEAIALGVRGTPTYFVNKTVIEGVASAAQWDQVIISQLR